MLKVTLPSGAGRGRGKDERHRMRVMRPQPVTARGRAARAAESASRITGPIVKDAREALLRTGSRLWEFIRRRMLFPLLRPSTRGKPRSPQFQYDAFLSYSQAADSQFAPFLQAAVQRFARPWYRLRTVRIFRDATGLTLTPELWPDIENALDASRAFILLASPAATQSKWVQQELTHWIELKRGAPLIVLTEGEVRWNREVTDFD
jgi:hypothetical protein